MRDIVAKAITKYYREKDYDAFRARCKEHMELFDEIKEYTDKFGLNASSGPDAPDDSSREWYIDLNGYKKGTFEIAYTTMFKISKVAPLFNINHDFYIKNRKIGGAITSTNKELLFCGIGLNLIEVDDSFGKLDISIDIDEILNLYFIEIEKKIPWKQIFSLFKIEFMHSKNFQATVDGIKVSLGNAILNSDGSIQIENKKVFSLR